MRITIEVLRRFAATVVLPGLILLGFGLRALEQDRRATDQQVRDRLRGAAELAARSIDQQLANWQQFRSDGVSVETGPALKITPPRRVAYEPGERITVQAVEPALADAEQYEQVRGNIAAAIPSTVTRRRRAAHAFERWHLSACRHVTGRPAWGTMRFRHIGNFSNFRNRESAS